MVMRIVSSLIGVTLALGAQAALAQDATEGAAHFREYCATCHGIEATGAGPMAGVMVIKPADLTTLAARNGGVFPTERVVARIDGRDPLVSHGSPMPVFGRFFEGRDVSVKTPDGQPLLTSRPIADLLAWLETVQAR
jgi:mono/diheme cytochrome c family protein